MKIDRRDALKKLAVGGVTAATASAVISNPVFGNDLPIPPDEPIVNAFVDSSNTLNVTLSPGTATCSGNASGVASVDSSQITVSATPDSVVASPIPPDPNPDFPNRSVAVSGGGSLSATFTNPDNASATAQINYFVNYRCTYASGSVLLCTQRVITFGTFGTGGNPWSPSPSIVNNDAYPGCPGAT